MPLLAQHRRLEARRRLRQNRTLDRQQGVSFVKNVVNDQHVAIREYGAGLHFPDQLAARRLTAIAGGVQIIQLERKVQALDDFDRRNQPANHHAQHHRIERGVFDPYGPRDSVVGRIDGAGIEQTIGVKQHRLGFGEAAGRAHAGSRR